MCSLFRLLAASLRCPISPLSAVDFACRSRLKRSGVFLVALAATVATAVGATEVGRPIMRVFTPRTYGADAQNLAGLQDASGLMYFANTNGVLTYDGATWQVIKTGYSEAIRGLALGADGNIYLGGVHQIGYLRSAENGREFVSLAAQLPAGKYDYTAFSRVVAHRDAVYFTTDKLVLIWRDGRFSAAPVENPTSIAVELLPAGDELFVAAPNQPLQRIRDGKLEVVSDAPFFRQNDLRLIEREAGGGYFLGTFAHGFFHWRDGTFTPAPTEADAALRAPGILRARRLRDGSLALMLASQGGVIFVAGDGRFLWRVGDETGLPTRSVIDAVPDREGGLWLCLTDGLARLERPSAFSLFDRAQGLVGGGAAITRHDGALYFGSRDGLFRLVSGEAAQGNARFESLAKTGVLALLSDRGGLLSSVSNSGIVQRAPGGLRKVFDLDKNVFALVRSKADPDRVWLAAAGGVSSIHREGDGWRSEGRIENLPTGTRTLAETADGALWTASLTDGVFRIRFGAPPAATLRGPAEVMHFDVGTHGLPPKHNTMRVYDWGGRVLCAMGGEGYWLFDPQRETFSRLAEVETQIPNPKELALFLNATEPDHLWAQRDTNLPRELAIWRVPVKGAAQALPHAVVDATHFARALWEDPGSDGTVLWIGGNDGLLRVETARAFAPPVPVDVAIRSPGVKNGEQLHTERRSIAFDYVAPLFRSGGGAQYQTRLVGFESDWTEWSEERKRVFTNLHPGSYRFEARARDNDGQVSAIAVRTFSILPPWWQTWWAVGLMSMSGIGGVAGVTRWFATRALRRRVELLEAQSAVERERLRLARDLHDEVGSGLGRVILFAGEARRNRADPAQLDASLERVRDSAQALVQHAREIIWAVSPQHDTLPSVIERFGDYVEETLRAAGIACRLELPAADQIPPVTLGSEARHSLFLAVKEAVHNCVKYSGAKTAEFRLEIAGHDFVITLRDEGRGFAAGERRGSGHGTKNLLARAEALGGSGEVVSAPGQGTTVRLRVPLVKS
jgi:signal transduction histidine kinase/ligand-binding sensor domain-containing protein